MVTTNKKKTFNRRNIVGNLFTLNDSCVTEQHTVITQKLKAKCLDQQIEGISSAGSETEQNVGQTVQTSLRII